MQGKMQVEGERKTRGREEEGQKIELREEHPSLGKPTWGHHHFTYNLNVSFHSGLREHLMVLVFCLLSLLGSGINFSFT